MEQFFKSIVLINSEDPDSAAFGTGFVICCDEQAAFVLTCQHVVEDIISESWEKVFINIGINPIGALTQLRNGELLEIKGLKYYMGEAVKEAIKVARMKKINLSEIDYIALTMK